MSTVRLLATIRREFQDHPGIVVTLPQAQSRWSLDKGHCTKALEALVAEGFLQRVGDVYLWANAPAPHFRIRRRQAFHSSTETELASRVQPAAASALTLEANDLTAPKARPLTDSVTDIQYWSARNRTPSGHPSRLPCSEAAVSGRVEFCPLDVWSVT